MLWWLRWQGRSEKSKKDELSRVEWLESLARDGHKPKALTERPTVKPHLLMFWEAFCDLSSSRQSGFGVSPIPVSEIKAYLDLFPDPDPKTFLHMMRAMDSAYIGHYGNQPKCEN